MGGVVSSGTAASGSVASPGSKFGPVPPPGATTEAQIRHLRQQVELLTKMVHILWTEAERVQKVITITPHGLTMKVGGAEFNLTSSGEVTVNASTINMKTPYKEGLKL